MDGGGLSPRGCIDSSGGLSQQRLFTAAEASSLFDIVCQRGWWRLVPPWEH